MAGFIVAADRHQRILLPPSVEEFFGRDAAVRMIDAFVASRDLHSPGFGRVRPAETGRPGHKPCCGSYL